jgi:hypothetical protein
MAQPEIVSPAEIVSYLGLGSNVTPADSGLIQMLKAMVENEARAFCGHNITQPVEPIVEYLPQPGGQLRVEPLLRHRESWNELSEADTILQLSQPFVRQAGLEVRVDLAAAAGQGDGDFGDETLLQIGTDYLLDMDETAMSRSGQLIRRGAAWPRRPRTIKVLYQAGLTASDLDGPFSDIKFALIEEVALRFREVKRRQGGNVPLGGLIRSESIGGEYKVAYETGEAPTGAMAEVTRDRLAPYLRLPL